MKAILTFHSIDDSGSVLSYSPALLDYLLKSLSRASIPVVDMASFLEPTFERGVVLTFDDGMYSVFRDALPILLEHDARAHVFVTTDAVNGKRNWPTEPGDSLSFKMLSWSEIEKLHASGTLIEAHTKSHPDMRTLSKADLAAECNEADDEIERRLGRRPEFFAYPFGYHNSRAREFCRARYRASVSTELRSFSDSEDFSALPRLDSYYFRTPWLIDHLMDFQTKAYFRLRWLLRTIRGSHCIASSDD